jgi:ABC-type multidrug transport system fused ATPase/permease subunit
VIRFLWRNLVGYRVLVSAAIALTFFVVGADLLVTFPLKFMLDKVVHHQDPMLGSLGGLLNMFDSLGNRNGLKDSEAHTQLGVIGFSLVALVVLGAIGATVAYAQLMIASFVGLRLSARLRNKLFAHLEHLPLHWHGRQRTGDLAQRLTGNVQDIEKLVTDGLVDLLASILTLVGILAIMLLLNWHFTVLTMCIMPPMFLVVLLYTKAIKRSAKRNAQAAGQVAEVATEDIGAITEVKAFTLEDRASTHFGGYVERQRRFGFRTGRMQAEFAPLVLVFIAFSNAMIVSIGIWIAAGHGHSFGFAGISVPEGSITVGAFTVFLLYSKQLYQPMRNLSKLAHLASSASSGAERIQEVLDQAIEKREPRRHYTGPNRFRGDISYRGVAFGYESNRPVLTGIDLSIPAGKRIALVGLSGSGKTTLVKLMPRFYDVWQGSVEIDGTDVQDLPLDVLRANISLVLQDSVLFEGTIRENIALGRPDATDAEIAAAADKAHLKEMMDSLPDGYSSQVREQGKNFSSGQRQRLAIARAILRDAPILILDEPTANLDVEAESEVMHAIDTLVQGRTVIMISHRLSTLGHVDEIVVLHDGRIIEQGTYSQLRQAGGQFAHMLEEQHRYAAERTFDLLPEAAPPIGASPNGNGNGARRPSMAKDLGLGGRPGSAANGSQNGALGQDVTGRYPEVVNQIDNLLTELARVERFRNIELTSSDGRITAYVAVKVADDLSVDQLQTMEAKIEGLIDSSIPAVGETIVRALPAQGGPPSRRGAKRRRGKGGSRTTGVRSRFRSR